MHKATRLQDCPWGISLYPQLVNVLSVFPKHTCLRKEENSWNSKKKKTKNTKQSKTTICQFSSLINSCLFPHNASNPHDKTFWSCSSSCLLSVVWLLITLNYFSVFSLIDFSFLQIWILWSNDFRVYGRTRLGHSQGLPHMDFLAHRKLSTHIASYVFCLPLSHWCSENLQEFNYVSEPPPCSNVVNITPLMKKKLHRDINKHWRKSKQIF